MNGTFETDCVDFAKAQKAAKDQAAADAAAAQKAAEEEAKAAEEAAAAAEDSVTEAWTAPVQTSGNSLEDIFLAAEQEY